MSEEKAVYDIEKARQALASDAQQRVLSTKAEVEAVFKKYQTQFSVAPSWTPDGRLTFDVGYTIALEKVK